MRATPGLAIAIALAGMIAGCGFQLRGAAALPFETLYMPPASSAGVALDLRRNIQAGTRTVLVDDPKRAQALLTISQETREKHILSLAASGRVREFQLRYRVSFHVHDGKGADFVPASSIELTREVSFSESEALAKEAEEQLLYRDMQFDMVQQIMRRLAAAKPPPPPAAPTKPVPVSPTPKPATEPPTPAVAPPVEPSR